MNDEQLDKILKRPYTAAGDQRGGNCTQKETKGGKNDEKKTNENGRYCRYRGGCTGTCLHCSTDIFCGAAKKMFQGYWGQRSELSDYVTRGVFSDQDEHMIFFGRGNPFG